MAVQRFLIDTDTAGDDVTSLLFGLLWPNSSVEAITVCAGNLHLEQCVENALYTLEVAGKAGIPVYPGASKPLVGKLVTAAYVHGEDGMGNSFFPKARQRPESLFAPTAIVELANRWAGELQIIAQAPLTNLALALAQDPNLPHKVKKLWIMGGTNHALGNITPAAEFNFYVDPEAAKKVLQAGFEVVLSPWDLAVSDGFLTREELEPILSLDTPLSRFYLAVNRVAWEFNRSHPEGGGLDGITHPDSLTMAMALQPELIGQSSRHYVDVECCGELTRGYSLVDRLGILGRPANAEVVLRADKMAFREMLIKLLGR
ncbi:nucleoside hydrolase [Synechococcus sp. R55.6]|uniref:nucleoside hydrolase n=1 Tax=unclassified Synechococcus TaxID=2626047 RepID=UPI0039C2D3A6